MNKNLHHLEKMRKVILSYHSGKKERGRTILDLQKGSLSAGCRNASGM